MSSGLYLVFFIGSTYNWSRLQSNNLCYILLWWWIFLLFWGLWPRIRALCAQNNRKPSSETTRLIFFLVVNRLLRLKCLAYTRLHTHFNLEGREFTLKIRVKACGKWCLCHSIRIEWPTSFHWSGAWERTRERSCSLGIDPGPSSSIPRLLHFALCSFSPTSFQWSGARR